MQILFGILPLSVESFQVQGKTVMDTDDARFELCPEQRDEACRLSVVCGDGRADMHQGQCYKEYVCFAYLGFSMIICGYVFCLGVRACVSLSRSLCVSMLSMYVCMCVLNKLMY